MNEVKQSLGGRLPLFKPNELTPPQKAAYDNINRTMVPWAEAAGFKAKLQSGELIGPFNTILASPEVGGAFLTLQGAEQKHTSLNERLRQVVILTVGAVWESDYERYAHAAVARKAGLSEKAIRALGRGESEESLTEIERIAQQFTKQLTAKHGIDYELYGRTLSVLGERGIVDLIVLAGCYDIVSSLLNAFKVPAPE